MLALFLGAGRLGADVGGVIYVGAAFGIAALYVAKMKFTPLRVAALIALPFIGLGLIGLLDAVTGGESHLTRTVFEANGPGDLWKVADRRFSASIEGAKIRRHLGDRADRARRADLGLDQARATVRRA